MSPFARVGDVALLDTIQKFPPEIRFEHSKRAFWLAVAVLRYFFGPDWVEENVGLGRDDPGFLRLTSAAVDKERSEISTFKIVDLAEILLNLQDIPGIDTVIDKMKHSDIESTFAEFDFGKMLYCSNVIFRFVTPVQKKGLDHDIEIVLSDGLVVCADAKCKLEGRAFSENTVMNSLQDARKQLPADRPSFIFVKAPPDWMYERLPKGPLNEIARDFLRSTQRVVSIKFYISEIVYKDNFITHNQMFKEISNPNNRFDKTRNWDIFANPQDSGAWSNVPARWKRLLFYPDQGLLSSNHRGA
jgi:hypothetical protein